MSTFSALATASKDPRDAHLVIRQIIPGMITFSQPFVSVPPRELSLTRRPASERFLSEGGRLPSRSATRASLSTFLTRTLRPRSRRSRSSVARSSGSSHLMASTESTSRRGRTSSQMLSTCSHACVSPSDKCRAIGVSRFAEEKPDVKWAGLFGSGGENKTYGFEPEVCTV